ncbi:MAG: hypothetical protein CL940_06530 [Deltaproteobacteria bacterium]|nr:hypothetical protein [Deltaproteobacteria bacterium]
MRPDLTAALSAAIALLLGACSGNPWDNPSLSDPQEQAPLSNGVVVSLGSGSFTIASTLLELSAAEQWSDPVKLTQETQEGDPSIQKSTLTWGEAQLAIEQVNLSASALGLELVVEASLQPLSVLPSSDPLSGCPAHVTFDHGVWRLPIRLTRSKLGSVQATAESYGELTAELIASDTAQCPEMDEPAGDPTLNPKELFEQLAMAMAEAFAPWLSDAVPTALGLDLATTSPVNGSPQPSSNVVMIDIRTSLEDEVTWWHWSEEHLIVGFDMRVLGSSDACVPDTLPTSIPAAAVPSEVGERMWLLHTGTLDATLEGVWRNGDLCLDRPMAARWDAGDWSESWPELAQLDADSHLSLRLWPSAAPRAQLASGGEGVEITLIAQGWTLELYGRFQGADVRLSTLELDISVSAGLQTGTERAVWLADPIASLDRYETEDGLFKAPPKAVSQDLIQSSIALLSSSVPVTWLPPTPQPAEVETSLSGSYLVFKAKN